MRQVALFGLLAACAALKLPSAVNRRAALTGAAATAASAALPAVADTVVPKTKIGVTPGGVKYFTKDESSSCSPFNPCTPQQGDIVKIKYKSFLSSGQMYDSSEGPGRKPLAAKYKASPPQMIPGWEEALEDMKMGQTRIIQVPANMAYGDKGIQVEDKDGKMEYLVPPGERLQFEITLVQVALPPP